MPEHAELEPFEARHARTLARLEPTDQRDPTGATAPLRYTAPGMVQIADWDAEQAMRFGYLANVIAYRCVQVLVEDITSCAFRAGMDPGPFPGMSPDWDPNAPLARFLGPAPGGPAPQLSSRKLWAFTIAQRLVTGRYGWELERATARDDSDIVAIWPLVSANLRPIPTEGGSAWFSGYRYGRNDQPRHLRPARCFYQWDPSPEDFRQPHSALQACRYPLSIALMGDQYAHAFLKNGSVPAAMVVSRAFANKDDRRKFRQQWAGKYTGPSNAGKTAFAEIDGQGDDVTKSIDVKMLGLAQKDAEFLAQHRAALELVAIDLGVPWSRMQAAGHTYDNASEEAKTYWRRVLSIIRTLEDEINMGLAPQLGREVGWFDLTGVDALKVKPEPTTARVGAPAMVQAQLMTIDEARAEYGLPPLPNGAGNRLMTAEEIAALRGAGQGGTDEASARMVEILERISRVATPAVAAPPLQLQPPVAPPRMVPSGTERRARIWSTTERLAVTLERQWERAFRRLFARQQAATLSRLEGKRGRQAERRDAPDPDRIFDRFFWAQQTEDVAADLYENVAAAAGARVAEVFGIDLDLSDPMVEGVIQARANQLAGQVTDTTYHAIQDAMSEGVAAGEDTAQLAARIRKVFEHANDARSVTIARTEVVSAFNGSTATLGALLPDDVVAGQEWVSTNDGRTREHHVSTDGQLRRIGQAFDVGGHMMAYPGDPSGPASETVNCRCTLALLTPDEMAEREAALLSHRVAMPDAEGVLALAAAGQFDRERVRSRLREVAA